MKKIAILQSNYIPWKGYFDLIAAVDEFILYDDVQFTRRDWRNRNLIKTPTGSQWISVPVGRNIHRRIRDVKLLNKLWQKKHWKSIESNYCRAPYFNEVAGWLEPLYMAQTYNYLSTLNRNFIESICNYLDIRTKISNSWDYTLHGGRTERLVNLCLQAEGTEYITGPAARNYIDENVFAEQGITLTWLDYRGYPVYPQRWGDFISEVTILDLLFNCGKKSYSYMKYVRKDHYGHNDVCQHQSCILNSQ